MRTFGKRHHSQHSVSLYMFSKDQIATRLMPMAQLRTHASEHVTLVSYHAQNTGVTVLATFD